MKPALAGPGIGNKYPDEIVALFAGIASCIDAIDLQFLIRDQRWNQATLSGVHVEAPAVVEHSTCAPSNCPHESGMPRCGQASRRANARPARSRPSASGVSSSIALTISPRPTLSDGNARYQKPNSMSESGV